MPTIEDFQQLDIRTGRIVAVEEFPKARKPTYKLQIDFGPELGVKKSCAQITANYTMQQLMGHIVLAVVNLPPRQIGPTVSEVLTLGVDDAHGNVVLLQAERTVGLGQRVY
ncbi:MAG: tRNA-binding protein [Variovorax sp.]